MVLERTFVQCCFVVSVVALLVALCVDVVSVAVIQLEVTRAPAQSADGVEMEDEPPMAAEDKAHASVARAARYRADPLTAAIGQGGRGVYVRVFECSCVCVLRAWVMYCEYGMQDHECPPALVARSTVS